MSIGLPHKLDGVGFVCSVLAFVSCFFGVMLSKLAAAIEDSMAKGEDFFASEPKSNKQVAPLDMKDDDASSHTTSAPSSPVASKPGTANRGNHQNVAPSS